MQTKHIVQLRKGIEQAAIEAGEVLMKYFQKPLKVIEKDQAGWVSNADLAAEAIAMKRLKKIAPHFGFLTEESVPEIADSDDCEGRFILDPLDGTTNFIHGFPTFCVSIAAEFQGKLIAAAIYQPILKDLYTAHVKGGAFHNNKKMQVSKTRQISDALLATGFSYQKEEWLEHEVNAFKQISAEAGAIRRPGSAALDLAYTAKGVNDGYWERTLSPWDVAAGILLVQEAGGRVTDFSGKPYKVCQHKSTSQLLATNKVLHKKMSQALIQTLK